MKNDAIEEKCMGVAQLVGQPHALAFIRLYIEDLCWGLCVEREAAAVRDDQLDPAQTAALVGGADLLRIGAGAERRWAVG